MICNSKMGIILEFMNDYERIMLLNIKKQISRLYLYEIVSGLQIVDAVWVFFLLERGFSLATGRDRRRGFSCGEHVL